jgi:citrate lyase subunit beta/citryl-CoA lyase
MATRPAWLLRSLLFAPGNQPRKLAKVASFGADAIVLDLEDAVAVGEKEAARAAVRAALPTYRDTLVMARVNGPTTAWFAEDIPAVVVPGVHAILIPKVDDPATLTEADKQVARLETEIGLSPGAIRLLPQIETARGVLRVEEIALSAPERVHTLLFGPVDLAADLGLTVSADGSELLYARSRVVIAARAAGLAQPIDGPYLALHDQAGLEQDSERGCRLGFGGRVVIYPPHVEPVNRIFSALAPEQAARARRIVEAFEAAEAAGSAAIQVDGEFVDYPVYRAAKRRLGT